MMESIFFRLLREDDKELALRRCIADLRTGLENDSAHTVRQDTLTLLPGSPMPYWVSDEIRRMFQETMLYSSSNAGGKVQHGMATKDDTRFLRLWWEVSPEQVGRSARWVNYAKGGEFLRYHSDIHLVVDWEDDGQKLEKFLLQKYPYLNGNTDWILHPECSYYEPGLTYSRRTQKGFSARILPEGCRFDKNGPGIFASNSADHLYQLGFFNSRLVALFVDMLVAFGSYETGIIGNIPYVKPHFEQRSSVSLYARECFALKRDLDRVNEISHAFTRPALLGLQVTNLKCLVKDLSGEPDNLKQRFLSWLAMQETAEVQITENSYQIDQAVLDLYRIAERDRHTIDREVGPHPGSYPRKAEWAEEDDTRLRLLYPTKELLPDEDESDDEEGEDGGGQRSGVGRRTAQRSTYRTLEEVAHNLGVHPASIAVRRQVLGLYRPDEFAETVAGLISYCVGCLFGRWDIRVGAGELEPPPLPDPEKDLPLYPPGALRPDSPPWQLTGLLAQVIKYSARHGILVDDPGHKCDIFAGVESCLAYLFGAEGLPVLRTEIRKALAQDLHTWLSRSFLAFHIKRYSKSRRKAPIYWQLTTPSKSYSLWLYYHALGPDTLYTAVREYVVPKIEFEETRAKELQGRLDQARKSGPAQEVRRLERAVEDQEAFLQELYTFRGELSRLANWGYDPDLNDGVIINIAPLHRLVPWREAEKMWQELDQGSVAAWGQGSSIRLASAEPFGMRRDR